MSSAEKRTKCPHGQLSFRFLCLRCGNELSGEDPDELADKMRSHFADLRRPANSGCKRVEARHSFVICGPGVDNGLRDVLFHARREIDRARRGASDQRNVTAALQRQTDELGVQLEAARADCR